jgi:hypothetical protein
MNETTMPAMASTTAPKTSNETIIVAPQMVVRTR